MSSVCGNMRLVFFNLDTSGLDNNKAEVLGIVAKSGATVFQRYIMPSAPIPGAASAINKLTVRHGNLYYDDRFKLETVQRCKAMKDLLKYLAEFRYPCLLIAHDWPVHRRCLMPMIVAEKLQHRFAGVIAGFTDTLKMFEEKFPRRGVSGALTLRNLGAVLGPRDTVREARNDLFARVERVDLLQTIAYHHFQEQDLVQNMSSFATEFNRIDSFVDLFVST